jgi:hypothetical protein
MKKFTSLLVILAFTANFGVYAQSWRSVSSGTNLPVQTLEADNAKKILYAGGLFTDASGSPAIGIAQWDGANWSPVGGGIGSGLGVSSMTMQNGDLIVGGTFDNIGGVSANNVAKWDGASWSPIGLGLSYTGATTVSTLCVFKGELYAGGTFLSSGLSPLGYIARWNGSSWGPVSSGMNAPVQSLCVYKGELYAGGLFTSAGGVSVNNIAKWDGTTWSDVSGGLNYTGATTVSTLCVYNGDLYAGGTFTTAGGAVGVNHIAKWNGTNWADVGGGLNYTGATTVSTLCVYNGEIVAGGVFSSAGGTSASFIGKWDGSNWTALGTGTNSQVSDLAVMGDTLYAGGNFTTAGGIVTPFIAQWGPGAAQIVNTINNINSNNGFYMYPNPAENRIWIKEIATTKGIITVSLIDMLGREIVKSTGRSNEISIERPDIPAGTYLYKIASEDGIILQQGLVSFK